jgi:DNA (cytosine-5)-methyltransferase 1
VNKLVLLDLYCGAGGAGVGYQRAGFRVIGVDHVAQPLYPCDFIQGDAVGLLPWLIRRYRPHLVHASPPCQAHTRVTNLNTNFRRHVVEETLLPKLRETLHEQGVDYVIENINTRSAGLRNPIMLCGSQFGLDVYRHRGFESSLPLRRKPHRPHVRVVSPNGVMPTSERPVLTITGRNGRQSKQWQAAARAAMGTPWITDLNGLCEAIPPAYTEHIGRQILLQFAARRAA